MQEGRGVTLRFLGVLLRMLLRLVDPGLAAHLLEVLLESQLKMRDRRVLLRNGVAIGFHCAGRRRRKRLSLCETLDPRGSGTLIHSMAKRKIVI